MSTDRPRRTLVKTVAVAVAVAALGLTVAGTANAAGPGDTATAQSDVVVTRLNKEVGSGKTITISDMTCPAGTYLLNDALSPGRIVPRGVEVVEPGGIGVTIPFSTAQQVEKTPGHWVNALNGTSWAGAQASNWNIFANGNLMIKLHCTSDLSRAVTTP